MTDAGLGYLKGLTKLQGLYLGQDNVTDAGLEHLSGLTELQDLDLRETKVTIEGLKKLRQVLPKCGILAFRAIPVSPPGVEPR